MYEVLDKNGIGYSDQNGKRIIIPQGKPLENKLIDDGLFTKESVQRLIKVGRLKGSESSLQENDQKPKKAVSPQNKKLKTEGKK